MQYVKGNIYGQLKTPQVSIYIASCFNLHREVFCPIQHKLEVHFSIYQGSHRNYYLIVQQHGSCFPFSLAFMTSPEELEFLLPLAHQPQGIRHFVLRMMKIKVKIRNQVENVWSCLSQRSVAG